MRWLCVGLLLLSSVGCAALGLGKTAEHKRLQATIEDLEKKIEEAKATGNESAVAALEASKREAEELRKVEEEKQAKTRRDFFTLVLLGLQMSGMAVGKVT